MNNSPPDRPSATARRPRRDGEAGGTAIEYALIASLIAVVALTGIRLVGDQVARLYAKIGSMLP